MTKKIVALVPIREGSERIKSKNFIEFYNGMSLLDIKITQLKKSNKFDKIYLSSDSKINLIKELLGPSSSLFSAKKKGSPSIHKPLQPFFSKW